MPKFRRGLRLEACRGGLVSCPSASAESLRRRLFGLDCRRWAHGPGTRTEPRQQAPPTRASTLAERARESFGTDITSLGPALLLLHDMDCCSLLHPLEYPTTRLGYQVQQVSVPLLPSEGGASSLSPTIAADHQSRQRRSEQQRHRHPPPGKLGFSTSNVPPTIPPE